MYKLKFERFISGRMQNMQVYTLCVKSRDCNVQSRDLNVKPRDFCVKSRDFFG